MLTKTTKKGVILTLFLLITVFLTGVLVSCKNKTTLSFENGDETIYLSETTIYTPSVKATGKSTDYILTSANPTILRAREDGKSFDVLRSGARVRITAELDGLTAEAFITVLDTRPAEATDPSIPDPYFTVVFDGGEYGYRTEQKVYPDSVASLPVTEVYAGFVIDGWYLTPDPLETDLPFDFTTPIVHSLTLYAFFAPAEPAPYNVISITGGYKLAGLKYPSVPYGELTIPSEINGTPVLEIGDSAFESNKTITEIYIPKTIKRIGEKAFYRATALVHVEFEEDLDSAAREIGASAFEGCTALNLMNLIDTTFSDIKKQAFYGTTSLQYLALPHGDGEKGVRTIAEKTFYGSALKQIDLTNVTKIETKAFTNSALEVNGIRNFTSVSSIMNDVFNGTPWYTAKYTAAKAGEKLILLGNILLDTTYLTTDFTAAISADLIIPSNITVVAGGAFLNVVKGAIRFQTSVPPVIYPGSFAQVSEAVALVVPTKLLLPVYYNAAGWATFRKQICYEDTPIRELDDDGNATGDPIKNSDGKDVMITLVNEGADGIYYIYLQKYNGDIRDRLDVPLVLRRRYGDNVVLRKIKTGAFTYATGSTGSGTYQVSQASNLITIVLPTPYSNDAYEAGAIQLQSRAEVLSTENTPGIPAKNINIEIVDTSLDSVAPKAVADSFIIITGTGDWTVWVPQSKLSIYRATWIKYNETHLSGY
ncbi:MAG: leucine-rich repeat domain-containing protein [Christensenellaceae bacterium]|jgi:hypothetical protein|nr:leucine-rich repeat domain-containing protein [Christensenellaceae bacterium]